MLAKKQRLTTKEFNEVFKRGAVACGAFVCVRLCPNRREFPRFACVMPGKLARKAHLRNRGRRRLYDAVEKLLEQISDQSLDAIVVAKKPLEAIEFEKLVSDIKYAFAKALRRL